MTLAAGSANQLVFNILLYQNVQRVNPCLLSEKERASVEEHTLRAPGRHWGSPPDPESLVKDWSTRGVHGVREPGRIGRNESPGHGGPLLDGPFGGGAEKFPDGHVRGTASGRRGRSRRGAIPGARRARSGRGGQPVLGNGRVDWGDNASARVSRARRSALSSSPWLGLADMLLVREISWSSRKGGWGVASEPVVETIRERR